MSWARIAATTIRKYIREQEVNVLRNRKLTALLKEKGRIKYNQSGDGIEWPVRYKRAPLQGYADADTLTFPRRNKWKKAFLDLRGYAATDSMTLHERLKNKSTEAIVKISSEITKTLMEDVEEHFCDELYVDGNASGNTKGIHGIESFMGINGTVNITDGTQRSANAADKVGYPDDSYATLDTDLGSYGGTWTGSWPDGTGDAHYDFWAPTIVNYTSSAFSGSADTFAAQGDEAIRFGIIKSQKNKSKKGRLDMILLDSTLYEELLQILDSKERFISRPGRMEGSLAKLGFGDVVNYDGVEISWEYGVPATVGYGFNVDEMELHSWQPKLFEPKGPDEDIASLSHRFAITFAGNLKCNPRAFAKWDDIA